MDTALTTSSCLNFEKLFKTILYVESFLELLYSDKKHFWRRQSGLLDKSSS